MQVSREVVVYFHLLLLQVNVQLFFVNSFVIVTPSTTSSSKSKSSSWNHHRQHHYDAGVVVGAVFAAASISTTSTTTEEDGSDDDATDMKMIARRSFILDSTQRGLLVLLSSSPATSASAAAVTTTTPEVPLLAEETKEGKKKNVADGDSIIHSNSHPPPVSAAPPLLQVVTDPNTYSALAYMPSRYQDRLSSSTSSPSSSPSSTSPPPLILLLHGAGRNDLDIMEDLGNPIGEHAGLIPSLIASGDAPNILLENFAVLAPYSYGKTSFYEEPRSKLLNFVNWAIENKNTETLPNFNFDPNRIILFGFSDGATVAVELLTTRRFVGGVICSYGYSGKTLPSRAIQLLNGIPIWVFHSADDVIFDITKTSDRLVQQLRSSDSSNSSAASSSVIRYSRYDKDPENLPKRVRGHSMGITASKLPEVYEWMLQLPPVV